jgi:hypothetical protein
MNGSGLQDKYYFIIFGQIRQGALAFSKALWL